MSIETVSDMMALLQARLDDGTIKPEDEIAVWADGYYEEVSFDIDDVTKDATGHVWIEASE